MNIQIFGKNKCFDTKKAKGKKPFSYSYRIIPIPIHDSSTATAWAAIADSPVPVRYNPSLYSQDKHRLRRDFLFCRFHNLLNLPGSTDKARASTLSI